MIFAPTNWLYGWNISYQKLRTVVRSPVDTSFFRKADGKPRLNGDTEFFPNNEPIFPDFGTFHGQLETNPHNVGHGSLGAWHANCLISPSDPSFWLFHAEDDRLWAKWQHLLGRFDSTGLDEVSYDKVGSFQANNDNSDNLGHNLKDTMWPWDGTKGTVVEDRKGKGRRPKENPFLPFPKSSINGLWPASDAAPTPSDMIDYLGLARDRLSHGVCYDDIPYGVFSSAPLILPDSRTSLTVDVLQEVATDKNAALDRRMRALSALRVESPSMSQSVAERISVDHEAPVALRSEALATILDHNPALGFQRLVEVSGEKGPQAKVAKAEAIALAPLTHSSAMSPDTRRRLHQLCYKLQRNLILFSLPVQQLRSLKLKT